ncbi:hypothetical protein [Streptomyces sp. bgisy100]|uniref:hypothetical protein n=1 Tax=Streptomyces sp. bgisy100 TaxID=3413783 RepID=UPI003D745BBD
MPSIRTARTLAAVASLPLAAVLFTGGAQADDGPGAGNGSNAGTAGMAESGVAGTNSGNSTTTQQVSTGAGASNQNNSAGVVGPGPATVTQSQTGATVNFSQMK